MLLLLLLFLLPWRQVDGNGARPPGGIRSSAIVQRLPASLQDDVHADLAAMAGPTNRRCSSFAARSARLRHRVRFRKDQDLPEERGNGNINNERVYI